MCVPGNERTYIHFPITKQSNDRKNLTFIQKSDRYISHILSGDSNGNITFFLK